MLSLEDIIVDAHINFSSCTKVFTDINTIIRNMINISGTLVLLRILDKYHHYSHHDNFSNTLEAAQAVWQPQPSLCAVRENTPLYPA